MKYALYLVVVAVMVALFVLLIGAFVFDVFHGNWQPLNRGVV